MSANHSSLERASSSICSIKTPKYPFSISDLRNFFIKKNDEIKFIEYIERTAKDSNIDFEIKTITINTENTDLPKEDILVDGPVS